MGDEIYWQLEKRERVWFCTSPSRGARERDVEEAGEILLAWCEIYKTNSDTLSPILDCWCRVALCKGYMLRGGNGA